MAAIRVGDQVTLKTGQQATVIRSWRPVWGLGLARLYQLHLDAAGLRGGHADHIVSRRELR